MNYGELKAYLEQPGERVFALGPEALLTDRTRCRSECDAWEVCKYNAWEIESLRAITERWYGAKRDGAICRNELETIRRLAIGALGETEFEWVEPEPRAFIYATHKLLRGWCYLLLQEVEKEPYGWVDHVAPDGTAYSSAVESFYDGNVIHHTMSGP